MERLTLSGPATGRGNSFKPVYRSLSSEFMPPLNEGSILYMLAAVPGMSLRLVAVTVTS